MAPLVCRSGKELKLREHVCRFGQGSAIFLPLGAPFCGAACVHVWQSLCRVARLVVAPHVRETICAGRANISHRFLCSARLLWRRWSAGLANSICCMARPVLRGMCAGLAHFLNISVARRALGGAACVQVW